MAAGERRQAVRAGVTGHQDLGTPEQRRWVADALSETVDAYGVTEGITSLAIGADQLFAELLAQRGVPYRAIIPCAGYEQTFDDEHLAGYERLLGLSASTVELDYEEPSEEAFFAAGKRVTELSELVVAVWNGRGAQGLGGTADVVEHAVTQHKTVVHINPVTSRVTEIRDVADFGKEIGGN